MALSAGHLARERRNTCSVSQCRTPLVSDTDGADVCLAGWKILVIHVDRSGGCCVNQFNHSWGEYSEALGDDQSPSARAVVRFAFSLLACSIGSRSCQLSIVAV
jgi:hypothetical protein